MYAETAAVEEVPEPESREERERFAAWSGWGISFGVHAALLVILGLVALAVKLVDDHPPTAISERMLTPPPPPPTPPEQTALIPQETEVEPVEVHDAEITTPEVEVQDVAISDESPEEATEPASMNESNRDLRSDQAVESFRNALIGGGKGGGGGLIGDRFGPGPRKMIRRYNGPPRADDAVMRALRWFQRHQSPDGRWDIDGYPVNCDRDGPKCEPGTFDRGFGDAAVTGYALMCFFGRGFDHRIPNRFRRTIADGIDWLLKVQRDDGSWGRNYENGVCANALAEAYAISDDRRLREPLQRAVDHLLAVQNPGEGKDAYGGSGWDYTAPKPTRNDSSVTGWAVMALKKAKTCPGIDVGSGLDGARWWLDHAWRAANPGWRDLDPYDRSVFPYVYDEVSGRTEKEHLACVGALCAVFLGRDAGDVMLETLANDIMARDFPDSRSWPTDTYYLYYNSLAIFQVGGEKWERWNRTVPPMLVESQRTGEGCFDGSWDPKDAGGHHIAEVGRTLVTAYTCLSLEVYYLYARIAAEG